MQMADCGSSTAKLPEWVIQVDEKLSNTVSYQSKKGTDKSRRRCIYRVPTNFFRGDDSYDVYRPYRVSFGPYFRGEKFCLPREQDKEVALIHFLRRSEKPLQLYYEAVAGVVEELKDNYDQLDVLWQDDTDAFLKLMVLDGCFLIEILRGVTDPLSYYAPDNPVLLIHEDPSEMELYRHDMLLLKNQLPMVLLQRLLEVETEGNYHVYEFLEDSIVRMFSMRHKSVRYKNNEYKHILEAYRKGLVYQGTRGRKANNPWKRKSGLHFNIPSATELHKVGIGFTISDTTSLRDISYQNKTLRLPQIVVDGATKSRFLNIMAFEQVHEDAGNEVTSYIYFMRNLIKDANDVNFLQLRGIINSGLPSGDVAQLFHRLSKNILLDHDKCLAYGYCVVGIILTRRFNKMSTEWRKDLRQNFLRSPWAIISVIAATLLFTLSIIQTVYTVLSYVNRK